MDSISFLNSKTSENKMPALFVGHGSPMNAIENNKYSLQWEKLGRELVRPRAILSISAHWLTHGTTKVTTAEFPETIHDFGGFPRSLYEINYPAPGSPEYAEETIKHLQQVHAEKDNSRGLDHGTWSVLLKMFPDALIPVYQMSIDYSQSPEYHFKLAKQLRSLRNKGVLIMGSGNIVHNLSMLNMNGKVFDWSQEFDEMIKNNIDKKDFRQVVDFRKNRNLANLAHPSHDHFLPLLYILGITDEDEKTEYFNEGFDYGSISMRSLIIGN